MRSAADQVAPWRRPGRRRAGEWRAFVTSDYAGINRHCRAGGVAVVVREDLTRTSTSLPYIINDVLGGAEALWVWDANQQRLDKFLGAQRNYLDRSDSSPEGLWFQAVYGWCAIRALLLCTLGRLIDKPRA